MVKAITNDCRANIFLLFLLFTGFKHSFKRVTRQTQAMALTNRLKCFAIRFYKERKGSFHFDHKKCGQNLKFFEMITK